MAATRYELNFGSANAGGMPTFTFFARQDTGAALAQPAITEVGNGVYRFDYDWALAPAQVVSFMAALNGIELFDVISGLPATDVASGTVRYEVNFGSINAGGGPTFGFFRNQSTGAAVTQPAVVEAAYGNGSYYFDFDWTAATATTISWSLSLAGIEQAGVGSGSPSPTSSAVSAATTSANGWQTVGQIVARVAVQSGLLSLTRAQVLTYDPFSATDPNITMLLELLDTLGIELAAELKTSLEKSFSLTTVGTATSYALPVDYVEMADGTSWNSSGVYPLTGPVTAQYQQYLRAWDGAATVDIPYRIQGNRITFPVAPAAGLTLTGVYHSRYWVQSAGSSTGPDYDHVTGYTDLVAFDPALAVLGLRYMFLAAKGLDTSDSLASYEKRLEWARGTVAGARVLSLSGGDRGFRMLDEQNYPLGPWAGGV